MLLHREGQGELQTTNPPPPPSIPNTHQTPSSIPTCPCSRDPRPGAGAERPPTSSTNNVYSGP